MTHHTPPRRVSADAVKAAVYPLDFYRSELPAMPEPKRSGTWTDGGLCPFHGDRHAGNFRVHLGTGAFHCFACGARGGDILTFTQRRHSLSFPEAVAAIADAWGVRP